MRIFWLGMHKVLTQTELPRLRMLGYEVFNPPYLTDITDQSAVTEWDARQPTTLPPEVFRKLSQTKFFYESIPSDIADILNKYFDVVIVTIQPGWLHEVLRIYRGKVIYRTYGQISLLSEDLWNQNSFRMITERPNFWFVPHSEHTANDEHAWLRRRMEIVPYHLTHDTVNIQDSWAQVPRHKRELMMVCPNIDNHYYHRHYLFLKEHFSDPCYRYYGVQMREEITDTQIVGSLPRAQHLTAYQNASGLIYTYSEPRVCYLPPIEMMVIGGPVVFLPGSLLARYFGKNAPGLAQDIEDARIKGKRLLDGDQAYIDDVIASQTEIRKLYLPDYVNPRFDETFKRLLSPETHNAATPIILNTATKLPAGQKRIYLMDHYPHRSTQFINGNYVAADGIPRVMRRLADVILKRTNHQLVITSYHDEVPYAYGFFSGMANNLDHLRLMVIDRSYASMSGTRKRIFIPHRWRQAYHRLKQTFNHTEERIISFGSRIPKHLPYWVRVPALGAAAVGLAFILIGKRCLQLAQKLLSRLDRIKHALLAPARLAPGPFRGFLFDHNDTINSDPSAIGAINPHYYFFMDSLTLKKPLALYLPDYIPHFYKDTNEFQSDKQLTKVSRYIVRNAKLVFTNSRYSESYLPYCDLAVAAEKIRVFPLPNLSGQSPFTKKQVVIDENSSEIKILRAKIGDSPFLFYPTQNRPNKNIKMLLRALSQLHKKYPTLKLVLTGRMEHCPAAQNVFDQLALQKSVVFAHAVSDQTLTWLYQNCLCLSFTSNIEGNFPPQINEALALNTPIVATRLPLITEKLGTLSSHLLMCDREDVDGFAALIETVMSDRAMVLSSQQKIVEHLRSIDDEEGFAQGVLSLISELEGNLAASAPSPPQLAEAA